MNALIVGNRPLTKNIIELSKNKLIIAADGGVDRLLEYEILPDKVIGDLDSISDKSATRLEDWLILNKDIQKTDLEKNDFEKRSKRFRHRFDAFNISK